MNHPRSLRSFGPILSFALTVVVIAPASAAEATGTKQTFFATDPAAPELANAYLRTHPGDGIEIVPFSEPGKDPTQTFHGLGPVSRSRVGVCRFTATEVFPHRSGDGAISWDSTPPNPREQHAEPPYIMAAMAGTPCPRQNEDAYAALEDGISDPEFVAISNFWKEISASQEKFDQVSVYLSLIVSARVAEAFAGFRAAVFGAGGQPPQLQAVFRGGVDAYDLAFGASRSNSSSFFLSISKSATGFQVLNFQTQY